MTAGTSTTPATIDGELIRLGEHLLYKTIKDRLSDHLISKNYTRVSMLNSHDPSVPMLSLEAEAELNRALHSLRVSLPVTDPAVVRFLNEHEEVYGESIVAKRGPNRYDVALPFLLQLLCEFPNNLENVNSAIELTPISPMEIPSDFAEGAVD